MLWARRRGRGALFAVHSVEVLLAEDSTAASVVLLASLKLYTLTWCLLRARRLLAKRDATMHVEGRASVVVRADKLPLRVEVEAVISTFILLVLNYTYV